MDIEIEKINFEGNILKVIKATVTEMSGINNHQKYDFDLYQIEARSPMSTREITLTVDFIEKKDEGDNYINSLYKYIIEYFIFDQKKNIIND